MSISFILIIEINCKVDVIKKMSNDYKSDSDSDTDDDKEMFKRIKWSDIVGWTLKSSCDLRNSPYKRLRKLWAKDICSEDPHCESDNFPVTILTFSKPGRSDLVVWEASLFDDDYSYVELFIFSNPLDPLITRKTIKK